VPVRATSTSDGGDELELVSSAGDDGLIDVDEASHLRLGPALILLTGCPTRREPDLEGSPVPAMARALFQSGARSVLRCSWCLPGRATDQYVMALYEGLAAGQPIGAASRAAKVQLLQAGVGPSQWAAFELLGDARLKLPLDRPGASLVWWFVAAAVAAWIIWWSERRHRRRDPGPPPEVTIG
jgi:CHAT domain-containing protein